MNKDAILAPREFEVTELLAWGQSKKEIAELLGISYFTIDSITRKVFEKCDVTKVNELSAWWFCNQYNIPFEDNPLYRTVEIRKGKVCLATFKRAVIAFVFLMMILPREIMTLDTYRTFSSRKVSRSVRGRRNDSDFVINNLMGFSYE